ncbi:DUF2129 domain-containing protein [Filobacillus milosensis]|uniref:DUF2129 domain-containing protein n=1 Tax=Filobacillus milosensis TaxID=94137 RepID=A0A4Y8IR85_9BACI|nr:DUF2129 domain-containing protein [Filobacillus milosensis]
MVKRQGLVVWIKHHKYAKRLRRYGHMIYSSRKQKYLLLYVDQDQVEDVIEQIQRLNFVKKVDYSYKPYVDTVYQKKDKHEPVKEEYEEEIRTVF